MKNKFKYILALLTNLWFVSFAFAQDIKLVQNQIQNFNYIEAKNTLQKINSSNLSSLQKAQYYKFKGLVNAKLNNSDQACTNYIKAQKYYSQIDSINSVQDINLQLAHIISSQSDKINDANSYINKYLQFAVEKKDNLILAKAFKQLATMKVYDDTNQSLQLYKKALYYNQKPNNLLLYSEIYNNLGTIYNEIIHKPDSALIYLKKSNQYYTKIKNQNGVCYNLINQSSSQSYLGNNLKAIELLKKADSIPIKEFKSKIKSLIYYNLSRCYDSINDYKNGFQANRIFQSYSDTLKEEVQSIAINDIQVKYQSKEKELENVTLKSKLQTNYILFAIGLVFFIIMLTIVTLANKNLTKKKKIAEQEKLIETQKLEKKLKEQELHEIDVMLNIQQKERQNIADELHDSLGSSIATLKMNFDNLKNNQQDIDIKTELLFDKTNLLIDETYQKIRDISHLKNLGVSANEGLLVAVKKMADKMSVLQKLKVNVFPFALDQKLDNQKEVLLFRIIQELCTNSIKHAQASEINIYLTQHNHTELNIIIEDNGKGFNKKNISNNDGIGLRNIEKKVEQLGGTFTIDSILSKGTTIIIDLPL